MYSSINDTGNLGRFITTHSNISAIIYKIAQWKSAICAHEHITSLTLSKYIPNMYVNVQNKLVVIMNDWLLTWLILTMCNVDEHGLKMWYAGFTLSVVNENTPFRARVTKTFCASDKCEYNPILARMPIAKTFHSLPSDGRSDSRDWHVPLNWWPKHYIFHRFVSTTNRHEQLTRCQPGYPSPILLAARERDEKKEFMMGFPTVNSENSPIVAMFNSLTNM